MQNVKGKEAYKNILSQWAWFGGTLTENFIGSGQSSAYPLLDSR